MEAAISEFISAIALLIPFEWLSHWHQLSFFGKIAFQKPGIWRFQLNSLLLNILLHSVEVVSDVSSLPKWKKKHSSLSISLTTYSNRIWRNAARSDSRKLRCCWRLYGIFNSLVSSLLESITCCDHTVIIPFQSIDILFALYGKYSWEY